MIALLLFAAQASASRQYMISITNAAFQQPFSGFFVAVHNSAAPPLYVLGEAASEELAILAEDGDPMPLVQAYNASKGVRETFAFTEGAPYFAGDTANIIVDVNSRYPYVSLATMAINTNDCFLGLNAVRVFKTYTEVIDLPGLDSGTEANNELCTHIPGPACNPGGNLRANKTAEGVVHVHRGFIGINEGNEDLTEEELGANGQPLSSAGYTWLNPIARVVIKKMK
uniref:Spondin domain-containing protein n=1 Tax=Lotharella oceanica TaxID=641309 RepID=A0A7S2X9P6_9EUKA